MRWAGALVLCCLSISGARAIELKTETVRAFDRYIRDTEAALEQRLQPTNKFLWVDEEPQRTVKVRAGELIVRTRSSQGTVAVPGGLIHDWIGAVFIPGVTLDQTLALLQDYDRNRETYKPEVIGSRLLSRDGNNFKVYLRLLKKKVITVVLDTEHDARFYPLDAARCHSRSYSTRIAEVQNAGEAGERTLPPGKDHGFLWRLNSFWRFQQRDGGVYVECEAISLTRTIPAGLNWLIQPMVDNLPRESLEGTLRETRAAFVK